MFENGFFMSDMHNRLSLSRLHNSSGFTLIEVMITVFVLAVGVLGVAGMQAVSVRESGNLYHRIVPDLLLNDMVDRMKANRREARGAVEDSSGDGSASTYNNVDTDGNDYSPGCVADCAEDEMATNDISEWEALIAASSLPMGSGTITWIQDSVDEVGNVTGSVFQLRIFWNEARDSSVTGKGCDPASASDLACRSLIIEI